MRLVLVLAASFALGAPLGARADLTLRHGVFGDAAAGDAPRAHLVPPLRLGDLAADTGSGAGGGTDPLLAGILGFFPGFGLGHYLAGAAWQRWALIDVLLLAALIVVSAADVGALEAIAWIATIVERVLEGLDAYNKAGGGKGAKTAARATRRELVVASAPAGPVQDGARDAWPARPPEVVLARF